MVNPVGGVDHCWTRKAFVDRTIGVQRPGHELSWSSWFLEDFCRPSSPGPALQIWTPSRTGSIGRSRKGSGVEPQCCGWMDDVQWHFSIPSRMCWKVWSINDPSLLLLLQDASRWKGENDILRNLSTCRTFCSSGHAGRLPAVQLTTWCHRWPGSPWEPQESPNRSHILIKGTPIENLYKFINIKLIYNNATQQQPLQQGARAAAFGLSAPQPSGFPMVGKNELEISGCLPGGGQKNTAEIWCLVWNRELWQADHQDSHDIRISRYLEEGGIIFDGTGEGCEGRWDMPFAEVP